MNSGLMKRCIVAGCVVAENGKVLLMEHKKLGVWLPPGGHIEENEFPYEAAIRETKEETGFEVTLYPNGPLSFIDDKAKTIPLPFAVLEENVPYKDGAHIHFDMIYIAKPTGGELKLNDESTNLKWFDKKEITGLKTFDNVRALINEVLKSSQVG